MQFPSVILTSLTEGTANLIIHMLSVDPKWVHPLPMDIPSEIPNTGGVRVTLIEANHCDFMFSLCLFVPADYPAQALGPVSSSLKDLKP